MPPRPNQAEATCFLWLIGATLTIGAITFLIHLLRAQPVLFVLLVAALAAGTYLAINRRRQQAAQRRAWEAHQAQIQHAQSMEISRYHAMGHREFEHAIAYLCQRDGCTGVQVVGGAGDLGADVVAAAPDGRRIVIQCKRYGPGNKVGSPDMQRFGGTCYAVHGAQVAAVVTTSAFTRQAAQYGQTQGIRLVDADALGGWATRTGPAPWHW